MTGNDLLHRTIEETAHELDSIAAAEKTPIARKLREERREHPMDPTPRPWRIRSSDPCMVETAARILLTTSDNPKDQTENRANAALIVTAVNSYDALREALDEAAAYCPVHVQDKIRELLKR